MGSLISAEDAVGFTGILSDHFDTFQRSITIHKEPLKTVTTINSNNSYAGYGEASNQNNFTYTAQNQSFPAIIVYGASQTKVSSSVGSFPAGAIKIKVKQDAADYIGQGKTEKIVVDGKSFNAISSDGVQNYLGLTFFSYLLQQTS